MVHAILLTLAGYAAVGTVFVLAYLANKYFNGGREI